MSRGVRIGLLIGLVAAATAAIALVFVMDSRAVRERVPAALPLTHVFDDSPTGFRLKYPDGWQYIIPIQGVAVIGPGATLRQEELGPSFTVQRNAPLEVFGTLEKALDGYLQSGPLSAGRWRLLGEMAETTFQGRAAISAELEGTNVKDGAPMHMAITATTAQNTFVYLLIAMTPVEKLKQYRPTLEAILASVEILE